MLEYKKKYYKYKEKYLNLKGGEVETQFISLNDININQIDFIDYKSYNDNKIFKFNYKVKKNIIFTTIDDNSDNPENTPIIKDFDFYVNFNFYYIDINNQMSIEYHYENDDIIDNQNLIKILFELSIKNFINQYLNTFDFNNFNLKSLKKNIKLVKKINNYYNKRISPENESNLITFSFNMNIINMFSLWNNLI